MAEPKTLTFSESPLTARQRFHLRTLSNWAFCGIAFTVLALLLALTISSPLVWLLDAVAIAALFYFNFFVLVKRPIKMRCPHCGEQIVTNKQWICGSCGKKNVKTDEFPFIYRCGFEDCGAETHAYKCHHCNKLIFLTEDEGKGDFAYCPTVGKERDSQRKRASKLTTYRETREDKENEVAITELDAKLREIEGRARPPKIKTRREQMIEAFDNDYDAAMGIRDHAQKRRAWAEERYKDDPVHLQESNEAIESIMRRFT